MLPPSVLTAWPTYGNFSVLLFVGAISISFFNIKGCCMTVPSPFVSEAPYVITPTIVIHSDCDPIGSRLTPAPRPTGNNPVTQSPSASPFPKIDPDTYMPTEDNASSPVTFWRGDLKKDITRLGIKCDVREDRLYCMLWYDVNWLFWWRLYTLPVVSKS